MASMKFAVSSKTSLSTSGISYVRTVTKQRTQLEIEEFRKEITTDAHIIPLSELEANLNTNINTGLTKLQADQVLKMTGPNCLIASATRSNWLLFAEFMFGGFAALLWIGAILSLVGFFFTYFINDEEEYEQLYLGCILVAVNLFTGFFGFYQEYTNEAIMDSFKKMVPTYAIVIRDGVEFTIPSEEVVVGDLIEIQTGTTVPADTRIIQAFGLKVDNSPITGESDPQSKTAECTNNNPLETANLVFFSTNVVEGRGRGIVIACGDNTLIGHIAGLTTALEKEVTPLRREIKRFIRIITAVAVCIGTIFFIVCLLIGYNFFVSFAFFVALMVANVPEGLPVTLTACMTLTAKRLAAKNCLVKKLECIETLGSCNVICSDKTGTLTQNRMTVAHLFYDDTEYDVLQSLDGLDKNSLAYNALVDVGLLCSRAAFLQSDDEDKPIEDRIVAGDASETAILKFLEKLIGHTSATRELKPKICEIPFNSSNKFQVSIHTLPDEERFLLVMKGAPERILDRCSLYLLKNEEVNLTNELKEGIMEGMLSFGKSGERVLAFADLKLPDSFGPEFVFDAEKPNFPLEGLRFVGLLSMMDPPRLTVPMAVNKCRDAGIRVVMVTGDHPVTAESIAKKVGIISPTSVVHHDVLKKQELPLRDHHPQMAGKHPAGVITGNDLREMTEVELELTISRYTELVFARTSPQQKLNIVEAFQKLDCIVAVTGDGVNDSPALKRANIGIAMGITGSDVAKNAADMILLDDNFASIVVGIEEGRLIFENLKKSVAFVLTSNIPEIVPFVALVTLNIPQALTVLAIVLIDIGTDLWPAISLAYEKAEMDIMHRHPRDPHKDRLINAKLIYLTYGQIGFIQVCGAFITYFFIMAQYGFYFDRLIGLRVQWDSERVNDLQDSYGQEWTYQERQTLQRKSVSGFYISIVVTQMADLLICKTRRLSLIQQGMSNWMLNSAIIFEVLLTGLVVYCPYVRDAFQFEPVDQWAYLLTLPFAIIIIVYDEGRKYFIRKYPYGFAYRETYY